ncbi:MAG: BlaI/MecI/CopY family transcriptional regulator [Eubacterium sp.]|nr:BlaI/MecI/CopY family transcriptional regulator [Eubacterium sp.]
MKKKVAKLTESENQVMDLLWDQEDDYLTSSEIVENCENRIWKPSYIHILINSLLKKEMIEVAGFKKTTKNYARTFRPTMTREEYSILRVTQQQKTTSRTLSQLFSALLEDETDAQVLDRLSNMLDKRKEELDNRDSADIK